MIELFIILNINCTTVKVYYKIKDKKLTINKVKYDNIFYISTFRYNTKCFICEEIIKRKEKHYKEMSIDSDDVNIPIIRVCTKCVKTPVQAEKIIIPLLKITLGCKIFIQRNYYNGNGFKNFYY